MIRTQVHSLAPIIAAAAAAAIKLGEREREKKKKEKNRAPSPGPPRTHIDIFCRHVYFFFIFESQIHKEFALFF